MLILKYTDPPSGSIKDLDITNYLTHCIWSGDAEQAARKLEFEIAYNSISKDSSFVNIDLKLGGTVSLNYVDDYSKAAEIFRGRIFYRKRNTNGYNFNFTCYDNMIYLAKSKVYLTFYNASVSDAIKTVCSKINITLADNQPVLSTLVNFIADGKSGSEVINTLLEKERAATGKSYMAVSINGQLAIVEHGTLIEGYLAGDVTNVVESEHGEGYESMINRIEIRDEHGNYVKTITANNYLAEYGTLQDIYKIQPPVEGESVDNMKAATALLHYIDSESQLRAIGNVQCITGYSINVAEEQLQGKFLIKSDSHTFENNTHFMTLTLSYLPDKPEQPKITVG